MTKFSNIWFQMAALEVLLVGFFLSPPWQEISVLLSFRLSFDLHIHGVSNALFQLVGCNKKI